MKLLRSALSFVLCITAAAAANCGSARSSKTTSKLTGPNGHIDYLNCGLETGGWTPPKIHINNVATKSLSAALQSKSSPFKACGRFVSTFEKYGAKYNIPPIFLAAFAMQESSCNANTVGGGGEQGLMQITREKCKGSPGGNCKDPDFNIRTGAKYFADVLKANNGDVLLSIGQYNGWTKGLTKKKATAAANTACCRCQNNLDYLHQYLNGWCQNVDPYTKALGKYFNLNKCR
ncbi:hypothetical protein D9619_005798 [Psilocybe cf. subviscida]|uniref:Transglycosylase SLT domain-containing protein n=1 Tax=Psilocybe cf. subviscida TaxID=2480587 RepID=A0A8H5BWE0_9AGAR|nr:hypothetical protein D9619_005798 [Psilocybe cf. subviscida]